MNHDSQSRKTHPALGLLLSLVLALTLVISPAVGAAPLLEPDTPQAADAEGWMLERIHAPKLFYDMSDRSLALDSNNRPHIAYGGDHLYYAWNDGTKWNYTTVDNAFGVGQSASLSIDRNNRPHISYYDQVNGRLKYAYFDGANWLIEVVDESPLAVSLEEWAAQAEPTQLTDRLQADLRPWETQAPQAPDLLKPGVGRYNSIDTTAGNAPYIAYYDAVNGDLRVARRTGSGWEVMLADSGKDDTGKFVSLAIDVNNHLHVSYLDDSNESLKYAYYDGSWTAETVDSGGVGAYTSIAVESEDALPQISYYDFFEDDLMYASPRNIGDWRIDRVDQSGNTGLHSSIVLDSNDRPHIAYYDESAGDAKYAYYDGSAWNTERLYTTGTVGLWTSIAMTSDDAARVSYYSASASELKFAAQDSDGDWPSTPTGIDKAQDVGKASSLVVDEFGRPQVSYLDDTNDDLYYAWFNAAPSDQGWKIGSLVHEGSVGMFSSIDAINGVPQVAYYDASDGDLRLLRASGSTWISETVDSPSSETVDQGMYVSLRLTNTGNPRISYYDATHGDLKFASRDGTAAWQLTVLDGNENDVGRYTSLALNGANAAFISYYDVEKGNLKVAVQDIDWVRQVVDGEVNNKDVGRFTSIAMGAGDQPGMAYYNVTDKDLMYVQLIPNVGWQVETVDSLGDVGQYASLGYDLVGNPHIAYYDATQQNLKYAVRVNGVWQIGALDTYGDVGKYASLYVDANGSPHITYYDATSGDLKYARGFSSNFTLYLPTVIE